MSKEKEIKKLEKRLLELEETEKIKGILVYKYIKCGKKGCHCEEGKKHGPYLHLQTYDKETKKIKTKYIKKSDEDKYKKLYKENKEYKDIIKQLEELRKK